MEDMLDLQQVGHLPGLNNGPLNLRMELSELLMPVPGLEAVCSTASYA